MKTKSNTIFTLAAIGLIASIMGVLAESNNSKQDIPKRVKKSGSSASDLTQVSYGREVVDGINIFYREAGEPAKQAVVLLHGFPTSSHMYRDVLASLGDEFYLIAPDYPGYGNSDAPSIKDYTYTFDNLAKTMNRFLEQRKIDRYVLMIHDFGAPVGFHIASSHPERVAGFVVMNGNAYEEGLGDLIAGSLKAERTPKDISGIIASTLSPEGIQWQYTHGTRNPERLNPDSWNLDQMKMIRPGVHDLNLELLFDYKNNLTYYPAWQKYMRDHQPPMLIVWGKNDPIFVEQGAAAYKKDVKNIDYHILDTGHFPLEEEAPYITEKMRGFLQSLPK